MIKRITYLFTIIASSYSVYGQYSVYNEVWLEAGAQCKFNNFGINLIEGFRTHEGSAGQSYTDFGLQYKINKYFRLGAGYRYIQKPYLFSILEYDHRFTIDVALSYKVEDFTFGFRPRYQHRVRGIKADDGARSKTYNRNKASVQYDINKDIAISLNYEFFIRLAASGSFLDQNRYSIELNYEVSKGHRLTGFYMIQQEVQVTWPGLTHVFGLEYLYSFKGGEKEKKNKNE